jgi:nucleoside-diphosphate-sugar epimerase
MEGILIAGCGYVGSRLGSELVAEGRRVFGLRRDPSRLPDGIVPLAADLSRPETLEALPREVACVVYAAGPAARDEEAYRRAYLEGLRNLLGLFERRGTRLQRVLFTSSTAVYGQDDGSWVDEDSPAAPTRFSGRVLLEAERALRAGPHPASVLRLGGIYGPGRTRLVERVRAGSVALRRGPPRYTNRIHRDDAAGALRHLLALASPLPLYLGVDAEPADEGDVACWLARQLGAPVPGVEREERAAPRGLEGAGSKRCRNARLVAAGYRFRYPTFREGYAALLSRPAGSG